MCPCKSLTTANSKDMSMLISLSVLTVFAKFYNIKKVLQVYTKIQRF